MRASVRARARAREFVAMSRIRGSPAKAWSDEPELERCNLSARFWERRPAPAFYFYCAAAAAAAAAGDLVAVVVVGGRRSRRCGRARACSMSIGR